mmetsp:Transcript_122988/g.213385  ORF Transcript_122988/g.213385 Transcript_122988/m.213385 type:complete len:83 (-) Transcript_122988:31-279(-)
MRDLCKGTHTESAVTNKFAALQCRIKVSRGGNLSQIALLAFGKSESHQKASLCCSGVLVLRMNAPPGFSTREISLKTYRQKV